VTDRNGNLAIYAFDERGLVVSKKEFSNRDIRPEDPELFEWLFAYDDQLNLILETLPLGNLDTAIYDNQSDDILARGNKLARIQIPDATRGGGRQTTRVRPPIMITTAGGCSSERAVGKGSL
jgi:hypothetical protein